MLQALLHKKLKASFENPTFKPSEDTLTSSVVGLLQYLPSDILSTILKEACGISTGFPNHIGEVLDVRFWEHWDSKNTTNVRLVEPDVLLIAEHINIIIEVKKDDEGGQYFEQWKNEIIAYKNTYPEDDRAIILLALGGNSSLKEKSLTIGKVSYPIYCASWFNLLRVVSKVKNNQSSFHIKRVLSDIINAFEIHGFFDIEWINSLPRCPLSRCTIDILSDNGLFSSFYYPMKSLNTKYFYQIWKI